MRPTLLAVPNVSAGCDQAAVAAISFAYREAGAAVLDESSDCDHDRSVHTLAAAQGSLAEAVAAGAKVAIKSIDLTQNQGVHPHVGALDVAPIVFISSKDRGAACAEALRLASILGDRLEIPVFLYGILRAGRSRASLRSGGVAQLSTSVENGELIPDFGPARVDSRVGATLVAARPPLVAFNLVLADQATLADARRVASEIREGGSRGLPGCRALGLELVKANKIQISVNLEDYERAGIGDLHAAVSEVLPVAEGELIGLAPSAAIAEIPEQLAMPGFDPVRRSIEGSLRLHAENI